MPERGRISVLQLTLLIWTMQMAVTVLYPGGVGTAKRDAWLGTLATAVAHQGLLWLTLALSARFPGQTLVQIGRSVLGRWGGTFLALCYAAFFLHFTSAVLRSVTDFLIVTIMPTTPISVVLITVGLVAAYGARHGVEPVARASEAIFPLFLFGMSLILVLVLEDVRTERLLPVLEKGPATLLKAVLTGAPVLMEIAFLPTLAALVHQGRGLGKALTVMLAVLGVMGSFLYGVTVAVLGEHVAVTASFPVYELVRSIDLADFFNRIEPLFVALGVLGYFLRVSYYLYATAFTAAEAAGLAEYRPLVLPCLTVILPLAVLQWENMDEFKTVYARMVFPLLGWLVILVAPAALLLVAALRGRRGRSPT